MNRDVGCFDDVCIFFQDHDMRAYFNNINEMLLK